MCRLLLSRYVLPPSRSSHLTSIAPDLLITILLYYDCVISYLVYEVDKNVCSLLTLIQNTGSGDNGVGKSPSMSGRMLLE